ncbi:hypothetical protein TRIATDRAFT_160326 [Trichoderma atroviride IMI 206040]|uniref:Uncharacterized protein n=1 Tax=Hypocrea atroviridis (strain ATCC 20476 / IMI 206040) TaxID=452589 RepID=G9NJF1_HYPAI|nr:uncharacterized protein TRIATDRAFT_160326 [Trichoderma atroviride IMI 206040]EHK49025.1 hypothetical protein TRIATDRAFT_160326 [Trichoderma atroviride IMI 206040]
MTGNVEEIVSKKSQLYYACFTILYSGIYDVLFGGFVGGGKLHVGYIMQQAFRAASIDTPMALGVIGAQLTRPASSCRDCCNLNV